LLWGFFGAFAAVFDGVFLGEQGILPLLGRDAPGVAEQIDADLSGGAPLTIRWPISA
jgi:hypothetical protein